MEQTQDLIANANKAQLYVPYTKRVDALYVPHGYETPKF